MNDKNGKHGVEREMKMKIKASVLLMMAIPRTKTYSQEQHRHHHRHHQNAYGKCEGTMKWNMAIECSSSSNQKLHGSHLHCKHQYALELSAHSCVATYEVHENKKPKSIYAVGH